LDLNLKGKVAVVAAASKGLGYASALALAQEGCSVAICSRNQQEIQEAARRIEDETGSPTLGMVADVTRAEQVAWFVESAVSEWGRLDVVVTNAGGPSRGSFDGVDDEKWHLGFEATVLPAVRLIRAALPHLRKQGGAIVNIQSSSVKEPIPDLLLSNSLRSSVIGMSKTISRDLAREGIRINTIAPGSFDTGRFEALTQRRAQENSVGIEEQAARQMEGTPIGRLGYPSELGALVAFLSSDVAAYLTGQTIFIDGGMTHFSL
jgi:3-oxoacyl-[acyl-carrier protein] reductase